MSQTELPQALLDEYWKSVYKQFHESDEDPTLITNEIIEDETFSALNEYIANIADTSISITNGEYDDEKWDNFMHELFENFVKNYSPEKSFEDNAYREYVILKRKYVGEETHRSIKKEDLIPRTKALYGIEFESIIVDTSTNDFICILNDKLYDTNIQKSVTPDINKFMIELPKWEIKNLFEYHSSGLRCERPHDSDKRLEFASQALSPTKHKPSELFDTLEKMRDAFHEWTDEKYYLPDHGTIAFLSDDKKKTYITLTGGTHMTISFPLTIHDNSVTWKYFMWLFTGLVTMYQPIYIALNGAPSTDTKGSERQRTSGSVVIGSAYIYDVFTPESKRYEIFTNSPGESCDLPDYPKYSHWNDEDLDYREDGPWRCHIKADIGNSSYTRSDSFKLRNNNSFILEDKEKILYKQFYKNQEYPIYKNLIENIASMTSNLIEFRFFDNEPISHLLNKFNLLIRIADYAYEQSKDMEASIGIYDLGTFITNQTDSRLNIRPLVTKKAWHDAVLESMKQGLDATFNEEFINECYEFLSLTQFSSLLDNPELKTITAIDLNKIFVDEINTAEHHFSEYFQTDNPTSEYSKEYQLLQLKISENIANEKMEAYAAEKARIELEQVTRIKQIIEENLIDEDDEWIDFIKKYIDFDKLAKDLRKRIYIDSDTLKELIKYGTEELTENSLVNPSDKEDETLLESLNNWIKESILPDIRQKEPMLKSREDEEDARLEREREREREIQRREQREREAIEQQANFIAGIIVKNVESIDEPLKDLILTTIDLKELSNILRKAIYENVDTITVSFMKTNSSGYLHVSMLEDVVWFDIPSEKQTMLVDWFNNTLLPDLIANIPELSSPRISETISRRSASEAESAIAREIRHAVEDHMEGNELNTLIYNRISFGKIAKLMQHWIYDLNYTTTDIRDNTDDIIERTKFNDPTEEEIEKIRFWIKGILIDILKAITPIRETRGREPLDVLNRQITTQTTTGRVIPQTADDKIQTIYLAITGTVQQLNNSSQHVVVTTISYSKLVNILYKRIYEINQSFDEIENLSELIIQDATPEHTTRTAEQDTIVKAWFKVGLLSELREILLTRDQSLIETRNAGGVIEHRHDSNYYWHPETRIHSAGTEIPSGHVPNISSAHGESEMVTLYVFRDENEMNEYIEANELPEGILLYRDIEIAENDYYNENPRDTSANLYKINIATNDLTSHGSGLFTTTRPTSRVEISKMITEEEPEPDFSEEIPTTYATELEALETEESEDELSDVDLIKGIIYNNIDTLENPTLRDIIEKYIIYNYLATSLHTMIYQKHYTTVDIENNIDILISEGFYDEDNETGIEDPEVIKLLVTWIQEYLIPDLVKGTTLQVGGLSALFG